ncbi:hypothetical protein MU1_36870 [Paenibacillus glycanilyticus]|uniref:Uncharacterized protein n=1 Tax=Paenibacillus glycanilyticus TaxID=126569 RepID=A0ABQ6GF93_9BACL|nr:hypothetical protein MU1_36870 [Paenibacillus glycanilyticus]
MERRYPWIQITLLAGFMFTGLYVITFMFASASYGLFSSEPADQSREVSWIYYGVLFAMLPYFPMGFLLYGYVRRRSLLLTIHAVGVGFLIEKVVFVYLGTLLGTGYPWYGRGFPSSGHALLCEELPMFCGSDYIRSYQLWGTMLAFVAFYAGTWVVRQTVFRVQHPTRQQP